MKLDWIQIKLIFLAGRGLRSFKLKPPVTFISEIPAESIARAIESSMFEK